MPLTDFVTGLGTSGTFLGVGWYLPVRPLLGGSLSRILVLPADLETMGRHGEASYPEECCGVLIGRIVQDQSGGEETVVERVLAVDNERQDSRHNRFLIHPETVLAAHKEARAAGLDVVGYYHSHPDHPARPSELDREHAWPGLSYVIVSVVSGKVAETRSWRLSDDRDRFEEEAILSWDQSPHGINKENPQ